MNHVVRRVLAMIPALLGVVLCIFLLTRVLPGDPARTLAGEQADPATVEKIRAEMGLDQPLVAQFVSYVRGLFAGDFGFAWHTGQPVLTDFASRLPATVELAIVAILISLLLGVPIGVISATRRDRPIDHASRIFSLIGASMPLFWLALIVIFVFYNRLGWEPAPLGRIAQDVNPPTSITGFYVLDSLLTGDVIALKSALAHIIWPALCLATGSTAIIARMTRSEMLEVINQDYVRTARSKGLPPAKVILKHALKNAAPVVVTVIGLQFGQLLGGAVITETVFSWPGIGFYVVQSVLATDYAPVQAFTLLAAAIYLTVNLCVDLLNARLDPRIENA
ncbi:MULTISPECIES: ABC transporter permease [Micromonospora]|uniref:ABC transporter permease n=1 Tax=Micromonospora TaxID=1873 RepID=UPI000D2B3CEE|nr:ABC transporter permease [Micromonospora sp. MH33]PSK67304.1 putative D,D-dipeptide transport system permease protein DdpB [Micromonospora sp. MH33]